MNVREPLLNTSALKHRDNQTKDFLNPMIIQMRQRDVSLTNRKIARERNARTVLRYAPKTSHQSNGFVEMHGHIQGLARCYQTQFETNTGVQLSANSPYAGFSLKTTAENICTRITFVHGESVFALIPDHEAKLTKQISSDNLLESSGADVKKSKVEGRNGIFAGPSLTSRPHEVMPTTTAPMEIPAIPPPARPSVKRARSTSANFDFGQFRPANFDFGQFSFGQFDFGHWNAKRHLRDDCVVGALCDFQEQVHHFREHRHSDSCNLLGIRVPNEVHTMATAEDSQ